MQINFFLQIVTFSTFTAVFNYIKLSITTIYRFQQGRMLVWYGAVGQISTAIGALTIFTIVNYTEIFKSVPMPECP